MCNEIDYEVCDKCDKIVDHTIEIPSLTYDELPSYLCDDCLDLNTDDDYVDSLDYELEDVW